MFTLRSEKVDTGFHRLYIHDDESNTKRFVASFHREDILDFVVGATLNAPYRRREELWKACEGDQPRTLV